MPAGFIYLFIFKCRGDATPLLACQSAAAQYALDNFAWDGGHFVKAVAHLLLPLIMLIRPADSKPLCT